MDTALFAFWFFLPAGIGNTLPIIAANAPFLKNLSAPLDGGIVFRRRRVFGDHKTWRGLIVGILGAIAVVYIQQKIAANSDPHFLDRQSGSYLSESAVLLGFLFGLGALGGDAIKSFAKRQFGIAAGKSWFPFDQLDYIVGACLLMSLVVVLSWQEYLAILLIWFVTHIVFGFLGYKLGLKSQPI